MINHLVCLGLLPGRLRMHLEFYCGVAELIFMIIEGTYSAVFPHSLKHHAVWAECTLLNWYTCSLFNSHCFLVATEQLRFPFPQVEFCYVRQCQFPAHRYHLWVSHHATYCVWLSLASYQPVVHTCSLLQARSLQPHAAQDLASAAAGPSTFWLCTSQWVPLIALVTFTSYGAD